MADEDHQDGAVGLEEVPSDHEEDTTGYKVPDKVTLADVMGKDGDDEALNKYKDELLGNAAKNITGQPLKVSASKMALISLDDSHRIEIDMSDESIANLKKNPIKVKEGARYQLEFVFKVENDIVTGLRYQHSAHRKGIRVDKENHMLGSYGPNDETNPFHTTRTPTDEMPSGMLARGNYTIKSKFCDDDQNTYVEWEWAFTLGKDW